MNNWVRRTNFDLGVYDENDPSWKTFDILIANHDPCGLGAVYSTIEETIDAMVE